MRTVENPKELFRKIDATGLDEDEYSFSVGEPSDKDELVEFTEQVQKNALQIRDVTVAFEDLSDPTDDFSAALEVIEEAAEEYASDEDLPDGLDTQFITQEEGETVVYMADTDRMGYEVINSFSEPRLAAYAVIFPDKLVKVQAEG